MNTSEKLKLVQEVGEEIISLDELKNLLESGKPLVTYDGFEPSGRIHIAQGLLRAININKMIDAGFTFKMLVADWHAWANHKMGGDLERIQNVGKYFIEVWRACGLKLDHVQFVWASDMVKNPEYWKLLMQIATKNNLPRILRTIEIMGRSDTDSLTASQVIYPLMQCTDIFMLEARVTQLGLDQRKVNMLAREVGPELGLWKPIVISHHMLLGLLPPEDKKESENAVDRAIRMKMSKSIPDSAIFMTDTYEDIKRKISKAWCPEGIAKENPVLEYCKYIIFAKENKIEIKRDQRFGGDVSYNSYEDLEKAYVSKELFPLDLKNALVEYLNKYLEPVRKHFEEDSEARRLKELVESYKTTR